MAIHLHLMPVPSIDSCALAWGAVRADSEQVVPAVCRQEKRGDQSGAVSNMRVGVEECSCGLALEDRAGQAYNEEAFRHFLAIEGKRAERADRSFLLLLASLRKQPGMDATFTPEIASRLFSGLALCVREVDFIGWYRQEKVAGAVLIQGIGTTERDASRRIGERVMDILHRHLPVPVAERLNLRVLQLCRRPNR